MRIPTLVTCLLLIAAACNKPEKINPNNSSSVLKEGSWRVILFSEDGENETHYFSNYTFSFLDNNVAKAVSNSSTVSGTWSTRKDSGKTKLDLNFELTANFDELNEDWEILTQSATKIELKHISGGNGGIDLLTLEKQ